MKKQTNVKLSTPTASSSLMWVDKYKPVKSSDLCANPGAIQQLKKFLTHWLVAARTSVHTSATC